MKRLFALVLAVMMVMSLATTAFAAEDEVTTVSLTIAGEKSGHTYEAYQIFGGKVNDSGIMTEIVWGTGLKDTDALLAGLKADETLGTEFASAATAEYVAAVMKNWGDRGTRIEYFADFLKDYLADEPDATATNATGTTYTFEELNPGYYLIKDEDGTVDEEYDFYTKFILDVTTSTDVAVKGSVPTVSKTVSNTLNGVYSSEITNQLNKTHYYMWTGTVPADIEDYEFYRYVFEDTLSDGLTFLNFEEIYIDHYNQEEHTWIYNWNAADGNKTINPNLTPDIVDYNGEGDTTPNKISIGWTDLLSQYPTLLTSDTIVIKYAAKLNENAIIGGQGNLNEVELIFSNNPHDENDYGKTPPMDPRVYSFKLKATKIDAATKNDENPKTLAGAEFVLFYYRTYNVYGEDGVTVVDTKNVEQYAILNANNKITGWTENIDEATKLVSGADGVIEAEGLQTMVGYYLRETKAPDGYNALVADIKIVITGFTTNSEEYITELSYEINGKVHKLEGDEAVPGQVATVIENKSGTTLPSTGGMGTTLFYITGSLMAAAAIVLLVTKKRMAAQN